MKAAVLPGFEHFIASMNINPVLFWIIITAAVVVLLTLKGFALWHAARNYQRYWFVALLVVNSFGILEIVYLVWFRKDRREGGTPSLFNNPEGPVSSAE